MKNKKHIVILLILSMIFAVCSCRATPDEEVVINKSNEKIDTILQENETDTNLNHYEVPAKITDKVMTNDQRFVVDINAEVIIPNGTGLPVISAKRSEITQDMADKIIHGLFGDKPLYKMRDITDMSKPEIEEQIVRIKSGEGSDLAAIDKTAYDEMVKPEIEALERLYETAPEVYTPIKVDGKFKPFENSTEGIPLENQNNALQQEAILLTSTMPQEQEMSLMIFKGEENSSMQLLRNSSNQQFNPDSGSKQKLSEAQNLPKMPYEEAQALAEQYKDKMGFSEFSLIAAAAAPTGEYSSAASYEELDKCYVLFYARNFGIPQNYTSNALSATMYSFAWPDEILTFYIDDLGISEITYISPTEVIERETEAIEILPFEDIMDIFKKQVLLSTFTAPQGDEGIVAQRFDVQEIKLGMVRISNSSDFSTCRYVPGWDFYGTWTYIYDNNSDDIQGVNENNEWKENIFEHSYYTINAIDGSIIDRNIGY